MIFSPETAQMTETADKIPVGGLKAIKVKPSLHRKIDIESASTGIPMYALAEKAWDAYEASKVSTGGQSANQLPAKELANPLLKSEVAESTIPLLLEPVIAEVRKGFTNLRRAIDGIGGKKGSRDPLPKVAKKLHTIKEKAGLKPAKPAEGSGGGRGRLA